MISKTMLVSDLIEELKRLQIEHGNVGCSVGHIKEVDDGEEIFFDNAWPEFRNDKIVF